MEENKDLLTLMMRRMMTIRRFEETVMGLVQGAELVGMAHCYIGEEAVAVGACAALRDDDYITGTHRSHGHPIAKGGDVRKAMRSCLGKALDIAKVKGDPCTWPISVSGYWESPELLGQHCLLQLVLR